MPTCKPPAWSTITSEPAFDAGSKRSRGKLPTGMPPKHSILVVDDDPDVVAMLDRTLTAAGMHVHNAGDADQARVMLASHAFDLVVLDVVMPGESGLALLHELRQNGSKVKVVIMTAVNTSA